MSMIKSEYESYTFNKMRLFTTNLKGEKDREIGMLFSSSAGVVFSPNAGVRLGHTEMLEIVMEIRELEQKMARDNYMDTH